LRSIAGLILACTPTCLLTPENLLIRQASASLPAWIVQRTGHASRSAGRTSANASTSASRPLRSVCPAPSPAAPEACQPALSHVHLHPRANWRRRADSSADRRRSRRHRGLPPAAHTRQPGRGTTRANRRACTACARFVRDTAHPSIQHLRCGAGKSGSRGLVRPACGSMPRFHRRTSIASRPIARPQHPFPRPAPHVQSAVIVGRRLRAIAPAVPATRAAHMSNVSLPDRGRRKPKVGT
jgi:hypothetical protein